MDLRLLAEQLCAGSPGGEGPTEAEFREAVQSAFQEELALLGDVDAKRTMCTLLSVYWIVADRYDEFVRGQPEDGRLSRASWADLQEWVQKTARLNQSSTTISAALVSAAIRNLGKCTRFKELAPEISDASEVLAHVLTRKPELVPSFTSLSEHIQRLLIAGFGAPFNFGQFLQAENLPVNLAGVKEVCGWPCVESSIGLHLFGIFCAMSGLFGSKSLEGSLFMSETMYKHFKCGMDCLMHLQDKTPQQVFNLYLAVRAKAQGLPFDEHSPVSRAQVRLACMARKFTPDGGEQVLQAVGALNDDSQLALVKCLNADGIEQKPGFLLFNSPNFLECAGKNDRVGLGLAISKLVEIYTGAIGTVSDPDVSFLTIRCDSCADLAASCEDTGAFESAAVGVTWDGPPPATTGMVTVLRRDEIVAPSAL